MESTIPAPLPSVQHEDPLSQPPSQVSNMKIHYPSLLPKYPAYGTPKKAGQTTREKGQESNNTAWRDLLAVNVLFLHFGPSGVQTTPWAKDSWQTTRPKGAWKSVAWSLVKLRLKRAVDISSHMSMWAWCECLMLGSCGDCGSKHQTSPAFKISRMQGIIREIMNTEEGPVECVWGEMKAWKRAEHPVVGHWIHVGDLWLDEEGHWQDLSGAALPGSGGPPQKSPVQRQ